MDLIESLSEALENPWIGLEPKEAAAKKAPEKKESKLKFNLKDTNSVIAFAAAQPKQYAEMRKGLLGAQEINASMNITKAIQTIESPSSALNAMRAANIINKDSHGTVQHRFNLSTADYEPSKHSSFYGTAEIGEKRKTLGKMQNLIALGKLINSAEIQAISKGTEKSDIYKELDKCYPGKAEEKLAKLERDRADLEQAEKQLKDYAAADAKMSKFTDPKATPEEKSLGAEVGRQHRREYTLQEYKKWTAAHPKESFGDFHIRQLLERQEQLRTNPKAAVEKYLQEHPEIRPQKPEDYAKLTQGLVNVTNHDVQKRFAKEIQEFKAKEPKDTSTTTGSMIDDLAAGKTVSQEALKASSEKLEASSVVSKFNDQAAVAKFSTGSEMLQVKKVADRIRALQPGSNTTPSDTATEVLRQERLELRNYLKAPATEENRATGTRFLARINNALALDKNNPELQYLQHALEEKVKPEVRNSVFKASAQPVTNPQAVTQLTNRYDRIAESAVRQLKALEHTKTTLQKDIATEIQKQQLQVPDEKNMKAIAQDIREAAEFSTEIWQDIRTTALSESTKLRSAQATQNTTASASMEQAQRLESFKKISLFEKPAVAEAPKSEANTEKKTTVADLKAGTATDGTRPVVEPPTLNFQTSGIQEPVQSTPQAARAL